MKNNKKIIESNKGITLVALIITIIVLLILAIVSIGVIKNSGIITHAESAKSDYQEAQELERVILAVEDVKIANDGGTITKANLVSALNKEFGEENYNLSGIEPFILTIINGTGTVYKIESNGNVTNLEITQEPVDGVTIPTGFYGYLGQTKEEGIIITDENGNQYVWVPVTKNEDGTPTEPYASTNGKVATSKGEVEIQLGRYSFDSSGNPSPYSGDFTEDTSTNHNSEYKNAIARDIEKFKESVSKNGGYFIGRYEAGKEGENLVVKKGVQVWNYVTQNKASELCINIDSNYRGITSDLINSYAWDTAIVFIQNCSGDRYYSRQFRLQNTLAKTGEATDGTNNDVRCNIYDMAGNCREWSTETCSILESSAAVRGGNCFSNSYASYRTCNNEIVASSYYSFRPILYWQV